MNRRLRRSRFRRGVALLALVSSLWGAWLVVVHGSLGDDPACAAESGLALPHHGLSLHNGRGGTSAQHCYVCHWLRSLRSISGDPPAPLPSIAPGGIVPSAPSTCEGQIALVHLPARSPPA